MIPLEQDAAARSDRRFTGFMAVYNSNAVCLRNPWVIAWWSAALPGFGHLSMGDFVTGALLFVWEIVINTHAGVNLAMVLTFNGRFEEAKEALHARWVLLYIPVYLFAIWDSYRKAVVLNRHVLLTGKDSKAMAPFRMNGLTLSALDLKSPRYAVYWSMVFPGLGHLYLGKIPSGFYIVVWCIITSYCSHLAEASLLAMSGSLRHSIEILRPEWFLFYPSMFCFASYDAYRKANENNRQYRREQAEYLSRTYRPRGFELLDSVGGGGS